MKYLAVGLLLTISGLAQQQPAPGTQSQPPSNSTVQNPAEANAQQARKIVEQSIQALGGQAFLTFTDLDQQGRGYGFSQNAPQGVGVPYERKYRYPDKERYEFLKKHDWIIIHNGDKGYETTFRGTRAEDPKDLASYQRRRLYALDYVLRDWTKAPGTAFFYEGTTLVGPKTVHKISLINAQNQGVTLYIDVKSFLPAKKSYSWRDPESKEMDEEAELYDEYRVEQGISSPHVITREKNGEMTSQRFVHTVTYNARIPDSEFSPPSIDYNKMKK
ncbi:MAG: hypothetical protein JWO20_782 [Candidatus Angelobacter sp.]|jgi:hypothetical protein|nr:hypothetical protein [Candidatus Angelobacter sp.]